MEFIDDLAEIRGLFVTESNEGLDQFDRHMVDLEKNPDAVDDRILGDIFRTAHSMKGSCGAFGFTRLETLTHAAENLLGLLRSRVLRPEKPIVDALLAFSDGARRLLLSIHETGAEAESGQEEIERRLLALAANEDPTPPVPADRPREVLAGGDATVSDFEAKLAAPDARSVAAVESSVRVDVQLLETLMTLVGELVLARNQILQYSANHPGTPVVAASQRLNLITTELQEAVMRTRMQPIGNVFGKVPRIARDVASACSKVIRVEMEGQETELDKTLIEAIKDPIVHLVRNSIDHGIEAPSLRAARGKSKEGRLLLRAYHEGGQVHIEISDDGAGIDVAHVKAKAVERGFITQRHAAAMSDREAVDLIFLPGFSSAESVTNVSGRGVGMDVVRSNLEKIGGTVDVRTVPGDGTTMHLTIPLTLAIIPACIVTCGGARYLIPQGSLLELVRLERAQAETQVEIIHGAPVYRLRGNLLPLVYLQDLLGVKPSCVDDGALNIVILQNGDRPFGLVVDEVRDTEEIVVKPLGAQLQHIAAFAGATIMGDGAVALILDVAGLTRLAGIAGGDRDRASAEQASATETAGDAETFLVCRVGAGRVAIPLCDVARLEEIPVRHVERAGPQNVVQYRGRILPLISLSAKLAADGSRGEDECDTLRVVVYTHDGRSAGLVVDAILDTVSETLTGSHRSNLGGVRCSAVVQGLVADVLDVPAIVREFDPDFFADDRQEAPTYV